jgi:hypothetical protein
MKQTQTKIFPIPGLALKIFINGDPSIGQFANDAFD